MPINGFGAGHVIVCLFLSNDNKVLVSAEWAGQQTDKHLSLWSWGANSYGQLGNGTQEDVLKPREITPFPIPDFPILITGGGGHTLILTEKHQIWLCGSNNKGQLGLGTTSDVAVPTLVAKIQDESVVVVTGGWDFSMAVTATGRLYSWGSNAFGQLGSSDRGKLSPLPAFVPISPTFHVTSVAAGMRHAVAITDSGQVFTWGHGKRGQLGILIEGEIPDKLHTPHPVRLPEDVKQILTVVAGSYHTGVNTGAGVLYIWGCNRFGQTTQNPGSVQCVPTPYQLDKSYFGDQPVAKLTSGWTHLLAVTKDGSIYSWGRADYGQLGRSHDQSCDWVPCKLDLDPPVHPHAICCGSEHNLVISESGDLLSWGWNEHGICGTENEINVHVPYRIQLPPDTQLKLIGCGAGHSFMMTDYRKPLDYVHLL
ncbi:hypothetical protein ACJMK2_021135 [Sinanodonta woodiana]|uniref:RCC1-like domain-containing protein n=1 Tax=Sinanodonta woodiana TaxID=1069815 RepID=A0ABD3U1N9_SINWO